MKTILALTLAALAAAEPEANADAYYGLGGYYGGYGLGGYGGYRTYGLGSYGVYGKREAKPEPEADAYYGYGGYSGHVAPVVSYAHHAIAAPVVNTVGNPVVS